MRRLIPWIFAALMGLVAVSLNMQWLRQQKRVLDAERRKVAEVLKHPIDVVVAKKDIPEGATLQADQLDHRTVPELFVQPYATSRAEDVIGLLTAAPISEGEQILRSKLRRPTETTGVATLSLLTPKGKRAVAIGVDALSGVGGFVRPGDLVDVLWTVQIPQAGGARGAGEVVTVTLFQGVPVLAVGHQMVGQEGEGGGEPAEGSRGGSTITLALTPQEASLLLFAREQGKVQLSLRSRQDKDQVVMVQPGTMSVVMETVFGQAIPAPKVPRTIELYKGLERSLISADD